MDLRHLLLLTVLTMGIDQSATADPWQKKTAALMTTWGEELQSDNAWTEYPRPSMTRSEWMNLNGVWGYFKRTQINYDYETDAEAFNQSILVPFPVESALSGIMDNNYRANRTATFMYRRSFSIPSNWTGKHVLLHFDAVDWRCSVYVNGTLVGKHDGGSDPFYFDITNALTSEGEQEVQVAVWDPSDGGGQPNGKQSTSPSGIWYTSSSGIWQTVWLEPVEEAHITSYEPIPDIDNGKLQLKVNASVESATARIIVKDGARVVATVEGGTGEFIDISIPNAKLWSPDTPNLYDLEITLINNGTTSDNVKGYFGMRKFSRGMVDGKPCVLLNNKPLYLYGPLDQGWWPDGLLTPPSYEAMIFDLQAIKGFGMNMVRKHIKVENDLWFDWCDRNGLIVWQDMISGGNPGAIGNLRESQENFYRECSAWINATRHHPCIGAWVVFNEGWGQNSDYDMAHTWRGVENVIKENHDPGRFVHAVTGWTDIERGDFIDVHSYPSPNALKNPMNERVASCGEFGGINLFIDGHLWAGSDVNYTTVDNDIDYTCLYNRYTDRLQELGRDKGLWMSVYTQITDVEKECNGIYTYDRKVLKVSDAQRKLLRDNIRRTINSRYLDDVTVLKASDEDNSIAWKYTTDEPDGNWYTTSFNDSGWQTGNSMFCGDDNAGTKWNTEDIWIRRTFTLSGISEEQKKDLRLWLRHDEDAEVYINGVLACRASGYNDWFEMWTILPEGLDALKTDGSENVFAIHCHQTYGGQFIDCGLKRRRYVDYANVAVSEIPAQTPLPQYAEDEGKAYLMAYTTNMSKLLHYAYSLDGAHWTPINPSPALPLKEGELAGAVELTAPFIRCIEADGKRTFHLVAGLPDNPQPGLYHWQSDDLINWVPSGTNALIAPTTTNTSIAKNPEWIYDEASSNYYIYWTANVNGTDTPCYTTTKDWKRFSTPRTLFNPGTAVSDLHIEKMGDTYYAFLYSDNYHNIGVATSTGVNPSRGKFGEIQRLFAEERPRTYAPQSFPALDGSGWFLYHLPSNGSLLNMSASGNPAEKKWYPINENDITMPKGAQQGSVLVITRDELAQLLSVYSNEVYDLIPTAETSPQTWKYSATSSESTSTSWTRLNYRDREWKEGLAGFGNENPPNSLAYTNWNTRYIRLRKKIDLTGFTQEQMEALVGRIHHDEDVTVYFNGVVAFTEGGFLKNYKDITLNPEAIAALTPDENNVVAIECTNYGGGQYIDFGLTTVRKIPTSIHQPLSSPLEGIRGKLLDHPFVYDLQGRIVKEKEAWSEGEENTLSPINHHLSPGIYIIDGKRIVVR